MNLNSHEGHDLHVSSIIAHDAYNPNLTLNDVALLRLAGAAAAPRRKLVGSTKVSDAISEKRVSTVIGFGLTEEGGKSLRSPASGRYSHGGEAELPGGSTAVID